MVLAFFLGIAFALVNIPAQTTLQERCPSSFRGRIFAVQFTLSSAVSIIPLLFVGGIADHDRRQQDHCRGGCPHPAHAGITIRLTPPETA